MDRSSIHQDHHLFRGLIQVSTPKNTNFPRESRRIWSRWCRMNVSERSNSQPNPSDVWLCVGLLLPFVACVKVELTPLENSDWNLRITCLKRKLSFQTFIFGFHVNFQGCSGVGFQSSIIHPLLSEATAWGKDQTSWEPKVPPPKRPHRDPRRNKALALGGGVP